MSRDDPHCYLCEGATDEPLTRDHVPSKLLIPRSFRSSTTLQWLPAHKSCNEKYSKDEEYFRTVLLLLADQNPTSEAVLADVERSIGERPANHLYERVLTGLSDQVGALYLPSGMLGLHFETIRIKRVIWKIARGIYCLDQANSMSEETIHRAEILQRHEFRQLVQTVLGDYEWMQIRIVPDVFEVAILRLGGTDAQPVRGWVYLFEIWRSLYSMVYFHAADCPCVNCTVSSSDPGTP